AGGMTQGGLQVERDGAALRLVMSGAWNLSAATVLDRQITAVAAQGTRRAIIDSRQLERLDTAGAVLLRRLWRRLEAAGIAVEWPDARPAHRTLFDYIAGGDFSLPAKPPADGGLVALVIWVGWLTLFFLREARRFIA